jgi:hypothetical protein
MVRIIITTLGSGVLASEVLGIRYQYLADEVGYGKSVTTAIIIVLCRWLEYTWDVVVKSR